MTDDPYLKLRPLLSALPVFRAVARQGNFTRAASVLHLTHGAVSRAIAQLEARLGVTLCVRHARHVTLTPEGERLLSTTELMLDELSDAVEAIQPTGGASSLRVSCEPTLAMRWLMPRLGEWQGYHPHPAVVLHTAGGPVDFASRQYDMAIRRLDFPLPRDVMVVPLCPEWAGPVCAPDYWQSVGQRLDQACWLHSQTRPSAWADWCQGEGQPEVAGQHQSLAHFYFVLQAALDRLGVAIGSWPLVIDDLQAGRLCAPFGFAPTQVDYGVILPEAVYQRDEVQSFLAQLQRWASVLALPRGER
ncbi:LysR substrate-binding domain-containing protein [Terasakiispira papahanaumokuakeensis]|uniref:LysR substrate-binding domain-containing protein n=1 Tax=Terasakiispira papahanaumokuakeensis TaxID=197479 RepID=UPI000A02BDD8|nr:LysR substrate-binding domain-containing protein [Terasakiispira papahanaumokuakeensis]